MHTPLTIAIAGSTLHTRECAETLDADPRFTITHILTPAPKPIGRHKEIKNNPLHEFAIQRNIPVTSIEKRIDEKIHESLMHITAPDILLVVDFGYIVPRWLLTWPTCAPVNIHPSDLPKYRGSSPGQFALLFGEQQSAITVMRMDEKLDHGPIITKIFFEVEPTWTTTEYYKHAFALVCKELPTLLVDFSQHPAQVENQSDESPTPTARMLHREDGFIPLETLKSLLKGSTPQESIPLLATYGLDSTPSTLFSMWQGLTPWPGIWTTVEKQGKQERVKLLTLSRENDTILLEKIQFEGKLPREYNDSLL